MTFILKIRPSFSILLLLLVVLLLSSQIVVGKKIRRPKPKTTSTTSTTTPTTSTTTGWSFEGPNMPEYANMTENQGELYYSHDGDCAVWKDDKYVPALEPNYGPPLNLDNIEEFHKWNLKMYQRAQTCGDPFYELRRHCFLLRAFDGGPAEESAIVKGDEQDLAIVILDGCSICNWNALEAQTMTTAAGGTTTKQPGTTTTEEAGQPLIWKKKPKRGGRKGRPKPQRKTTTTPPPKIYPAVETEIWTSYEWKKGSFFTTCKAVTKESVKVKMSLLNESSIRDGPVVEGDPIKVGNMFMAGIFYQRNCAGFFGSDPIADRFENVKLHIRHNCNLEGKIVEMEVGLPDVVPKDHPNHIVEMGGLKVELHQNQLTQMHFREDGTFAESAGLSWDSLPKKNVNG